MASQGIDIWVDNHLFVEICRALRMHVDSDRQIVALNASHHIVIRPTVKKIFEKYSDEFGLIRLEEWKEGLVLWVCGQIKWKSWENNK
jgi:hypothetical protein